MSRLEVTAIAVLTAVAILGPGPSQASSAMRDQWRITDLGTLGGSTSGDPILGDRGEIVGTSETRNGRSHAFLWRDGRMIDLGSFGADESAAVAVNGSGQILVNSARREDNGLDHPVRAFVWQNGRKTGLVGTGQWTRGEAINERGQVIGEQGGAQASPFLWENGHVIGLPTLGGDNTWASALNEHGQVVGESDRVPPRHPQWLETHAVLWEQGRLRDLGARGTQSWASDINESGRIVGWSGRRAVLWDNGKMLRLGSLGARSPQDEAVAVNDRGQVVGTAKTSGARIHAFVWEDGRLRDLGTLGGGYSWAEAIDEQGRIVGSSVGKDGFRHAVIWNGGTITDLGTLGGHRSWAVDVNGRGQIVGVSESANGDEHVALWTLRTK